MNEYTEQAEKFLKETNTTFKAEFFRNGLHFEGDTEPRDIYKITLTRGERVYKFDFGQSIAESGLRLFHDKEKTKRTRHKNFAIPQEIRNKQKEFNLRQKDKKSIFGKYQIIRRWFETEHFSLSGLHWDLGKEPTAYDVLTCLTKNEVGTFEDFCGDYGYDEDSRKAEKTYKAVLEEWKQVKILWSDEEIELLQEIQ